MPVYRYTLHPGSGQNPPSNGANQALRAGTNFTWREQVQPQGEDTETHFQGIVVPDGVLASGNLTFRTTWRQIGANVGPNIRANLGYLQLSSGPRDAAPTFIGAVNIPASGFDGGEFSHDFLVALGGFTPGEELPFKVQRLGSDPGDDLQTDIALVRAEVLIPAADTFLFDSEWDQNHPILGTYELWVDALGRLRIKNGPPVSDTDGTIVGTQS